MRLDINIDRRERRKYRQIKRGGRILVKFNFREANVNIPNVKEAIALRNNVNKTLVPLKEYELMT